MKNFFNRAETFLNLKQQRASSRTGEMSLVALYGRIQQLKIDELGTTHLIKLQLKPNLTSRLPATTDAALTACHEKLPPGANMVGK
ncbi:hypothetical protein AVEN_59010-1 [Araneus ventricosus]|uniref:Uncharacterized protein n=1 Tax=Araneus ventricosus TaxID=182803 RepID=A0A4Y2QS12_ARAVE|nr:hypothetical protein AVEN_59010-1 [Araneus ventricosus]